MHLHVNTHPIGSIGSEPLHEALQQDLECAVPYCLEGSMQACLAAYLHRQQQQADERQNWKTDDRCNELHELDEDEHIIELK